MDDFSGNDEIKGVVFVSGRDEQFIVGANIEEIAAFTTAADATERITDAANFLKLRT